MPTTRRRHVLTETEALARALDDAAKRWPADKGSRSTLLRRLLDEGHRAVLASREEAARQRQEAVRGTAGALTGLYGEGYLEEMRGEWPE